MISATFKQFLATLIKKIIRIDEEGVFMIKRGFIQLNGPSSGYKGIRKFLKAFLLSMYGSAYSFHIGNPTSEIMKRFVT